MLIANHCGRRLAGVLHQWSPLVYQLATTSPSPLSFSLPPLQMPWHNYFVFFSLSIYIFINVKCSAARVRLLAERCSAEVETQWHFPSNGCCRRQSAVRISLCKLGGCWGRRDSGIYRRWFDSQLYLPRTGQTVVRNKSSALSQTCEDV